MKSSSLLKLVAQGGGAAAGAKIGTMILPGWGTAAGAGVGYLCGLAFGADEDNVSSTSSLDNSEIEQRLVAADKKANKKLEKLVNSLNTNKGSQDLQAQQQYQASQQQFMMMMLLFSQNQKPALEAGQSLAREELREIKKALKDAEKQNQDLLAKIKAFEEEKTSKEQEKEGIQAEISKLDEDLADKKLTANEHQQRVAVLRQQEQAAQTRIEEILASVATLQTELQNCSTNKDGLIAKEEEVKDKLETYQQQMNKLAETLNNVANQHGINKQVPVVNINSTKPLNSRINPSDSDSSVSDSGYQQQQNSGDSFKEWLQEAKPYLKWGGIGLGIVFVVSIIFKFFNSLMRMF